MGRSQGRLTTKIHAIVDANGPPITLKLTPGQANDGRSADDMLTTVKADDTRIAHAGYDGDRLRADLKRRGVKACIKPMQNGKRPTARARPSMRNAPSSSVSSTGSNTFAPSPTASKNTPSGISPS